MPIFPPSRDNYNPQRLYHHKNVENEKCELWCIMSIIKTSLIANKGTKHGVKFLLWLLNIAKSEIFFQRRKFNFFHFLLQSWKANSMWCYLYPKHTFQYMNVLCSSKLIFGFNISHECIKYSTQIWISARWWNAR